MEARLPTYYLFPRLHHIHTHVELVRLLRFSYFYSFSGLTIFILFLLGIVYPIKLKFVEKLTYIHIIVDSCTFLILTGPSQFHLLVLRFDMVRITCSVFKLVFSANFQNADFILFLLLLFFF